MRARRRSGRRSRRGPGRGAGGGGAVITVRLPDGSTKELDDGATALDLAAVDRSAPGQGGGGGHRRRRPVDLGTALARRRRGGGDHRGQRRRAGPCCATPPPTCWPRPCSSCGPGAHYAIGPSIADGFYYDFELPGGATFSDDDLGRIEEKMRAIMAADQALRARGALDRRGPGAVRRPALQARDHRGRRRRDARRRALGRGRRPTSPPTPRR